MTETMTAKEYLAQARRAERRIVALKERRQRYEELASQQTAHYRAGPGGGTRRVSSVEEYACKLADLTRELDRRIADHTRLIREIEAAIDGVQDADQREVLGYRYLNGWSWERIASEMHYSQRWVISLHGRGLQSVVVPEERRTL